MQSNPRTPAEIFGQDIRHVVPLFQRPYVWNREDQWEPLWNDVRGVAERLLDAPKNAFGLATVPPHFLGAIVLDQQYIPSGYIAVRSIIDGQQRLTTIQLLLDAAELVTRRHGNPKDAEGLRVLIRNDPEITQEAHEVFKVWPTDWDQASFEQAMSDTDPDPDAVPRSAIGSAHKYFRETIEGWALGLEPDQAALRLKALVEVLRNHLKVVVIDLQEGDNAQVIFETLNHRGTPLLAADLIKNLVFQLAQAQGEDVAKLYKEYWRPLDSAKWRAVVRQGRLNRPRIDVFMNHWLTMKLLKEVPADRIFTAFRDDLLPEYVGTASALVQEIAADSEAYSLLESAPAATPEGRFFYRVVIALDTSTVNPVLLWALRQSPKDLPPGQRIKLIDTLESWLVRRTLVGATTSDNNRALLDLLRQLNSAGPLTAGETAVEFFTSRTATSRLWPTDDDLRLELATRPVYTSLVRARLRMILEAIEEATRTKFGEGMACPRDLTVEHVMPQGWREHWGSDLANDESGKINRDKVVQRLGNLTLVTGKLNPSLSNLPWTDTEAVARDLGSTGKRSRLLENSELKMNAGLAANHSLAWTEADIAARTSAMVEIICKVWPRS